MKISLIFASVMLRRWSIITLTLEALQDTFQVISQNNQPITFYSRKLNPVQVNYTTTKRELLSVVETLKEFRNILLGQEKLKVYTDHKNITYKTFNTEQVMHWRLILEEFGPEIIYIQENNFFLGGLS